MVLYKNMKINKIILLYEKYGMPTKELATNETIRIHLVNKEFEMPNGCFSFNTIEHIRGNLYRMDTIFGKFDFCFRPKWYQYPKIMTYYVFKLFPKIKSLIW